MRLAARGLLLVAVVLAACGGGRPAATDAYACPTPATSSFDPGPDVLGPGDGLNIANQQRGLFGLPAATVEQLSTPDARRLYMQYGNHILPEEESAWQARLALEERMRSAYEQAINDPAFFEGTADELHQRMTLYVRTDGVERIRALVADLPMTVVETPYSLSDVEAEEHRVIDSMDPDLQKVVVTYGVGDNVVEFGVLCTSPRRDEAAQAIRDAQPTVPYTIKAQQQPALA
jgi:hypothetical protein